MSAMALLPDISRVITPAGETDLVTLDRVKLELGITNSASDALLAHFIDEATGAILTYLGRTLAVEVVEDRFRLDTAGAADSLMLSRWPVSAIGSITEDGTALVAADYEIVTDVGSQANTGELWRLDSDGVRQSWETGPVLVRFTAGYASYPPELTRAAIDLVKHRWFSGRRDPMVKGEDVPGVYSVQYWVGQVGQGGTLPVSDPGSLDRYRRIAV